MTRPLTVAILLISTVPLFAQGQQPNVAKLKADAQKVVSVISGDKAKTQTVHNYLWLTEKLGHRARPRSFKTDITSTGSFSLRCGLHGLTRYSAGGTERT